MNTAYQLAGGLFLGAGLLSAATADPGKTPAAPDAQRCHAVVQLVVDHKGSTDRDMTFAQSSSMDHMLDLLAACPGQEKLSKASDVFYDFDRVQAMQDSPDPTVADPKATEAELEETRNGHRAEAQRHVDGYRRQMTKGELDTQALKTLLRYAIWQRDDSSHEWVALELTARLFPADYDAMRPLTQGGGGESAFGEYWGEVRKQWLAKPGPSKH